MLPACSCSPFAVCCCRAGEGRLPFCGLEADGALWPLCTDHGRHRTFSSCLLSAPQKPEMRHLVPRRVGILATLSEDSLGPSAQRVTILE